MFILDKHVVAGRGQVVVNTYSDNWQTRNIPNNYGVTPTVCSGEKESYSSNFRWTIYNMQVFDATGADATLSWNRMSDGALVMDQQLGIGLYGTWPSYYGWSTDDEELKTLFNSQWGTTEGSLNQNRNNRWNLFNWRQTLGSFAGAAYVLKFVRVGFNANLQNIGEAKKYLTNGVDTAANLGSGVVYDFFGQGNSSYEDYKSGTLSVGSSTFGTYTNDGPTIYVNNAITRLIAIPTGTVPTLSPGDTSLGVITEPTSVTINSAASAAITVYVDGEQKTSQSGTSQVVVNLATWWDQLSLGAHTIIVTASLNGYKTGARIRFTKSTSMVSAMGKPQSFGDMPTMCYMADNLTVPANATAVREVCNNGNDSEPTWEVYEGDGHHFSNDKKTATDWALNWRIGIDNSLGTSQARINTGVNMGVLVKGGAGPKEQE